MFGLDDMAGAALLGTGVDFLSGLFSNKSNAEQNELNRQWQSAENEKSRNFQSGQNSLDRGQQNYWNQKSLDWQEKMWNLQNQYNTPSAMMARYREAGLNPYLNGLSQMGSGAGAASPPGSPSIGTSPAGSSAPMSGAPSSIPMVAPHLDLSTALGVSANIANQSADTLKKKWEIYNSIIENGDRDTAKKFLKANPDMMSDADPQNSLYYKRWLRADAASEVETLRNNWEYNLRQLYGVKQAEKEIEHTDACIKDIQSLMDKRTWDIKEIQANLRKIDEQIRTEKSVQSRNYAEAGLARARTDTENQTREYVVKQLLLNSNILEFDEQTQRALFESKESLRGWLTSDEAKKAFAKAARNHGLWDADAVRSSLLEFLDHVHVSAVAH